MKVLIGCEHSGRVRNAFLALGHDAYSCDTEPASDNSPRHFRCNVLFLLEAGGWDLFIGHPPCQYLTLSGVHLLHSKPERWKKMCEAAYFFLRLWAAPVPRVCIEHPIMHGYAQAIIQVPAVQMIQPHQFGDPESKATCLWLRGLPNLQSTTACEPDLFQEHLPKPKNGRWANQTKSGQNALGPSPERGKVRGVTYPGIAAAMAEQWSKTYEPATNPH